MNTPIPAVAILTACLALLAPTHSHAADSPTVLLPQKATLAQTKHADVDGDGRRDTIRIYKVGVKDFHVQWKVKVTTAKHKTKSLTYTSPGFSQDAPWYGWAKLDGRRGAELLLNGYTDDFFTVTVLTWKSGKLSLEKTPDYPGYGRDDAWPAATETDSSGYRFFTANKQRYVEEWQADCPDNPDPKVGTCTVKTVRSIWSKGDWHTSGAPKTSTASAADIHSRQPLGSLKIHR